MTGGRRSEKWAATRRRSGTASAGTSFATLDKWKAKDFKYGNPNVTLFADKTQAGSLGAVEYDDEAELVDAAEPFVEERLLDLAYDRLVTGLGAHLGDPSAHQTAPHHSHN